MRAIVLGLIFLLHGHLVFAAPAPSLLQAAGLSPPAEPRAAADFQLPDLSGHLQRLQDQRGRVVFLNFWATWCAPCRFEMPEMEALFQALRKRPFTVWAVAMQENREQVMPFFKELGLHFPALLDVKGDVSALYGIRGLPTTLLIDCSGHMVGKVIGPRPWNNKAVHQLMTALLQDDQCR